MKLYKNPMKMSKTTEKKQSKMDFYQYSDADSSTVACTYSYRAGSKTPMNVLPTIFVKRW